MSRPTFMTLAPNSITKVRVYVYIEGQDIDNFDYASVGKYIKVGFGFTKQRFTSDDVDVTEGELYDNLPTAVHPTASHYGVLESVFHTSSALSHHQKEHSRIF